MARNSRSRSVAGAGSGGITGAVKGGAEFMLNAATVTHPALHFKQSLPAYADMLCPRSQAMTRQP